MNEQPSLFDAPMSQAAKEAGMQQASANKASLLAYARGVAVELARARSDRLVTADDVQQELVNRGVSAHALGNAAGSLFKGDDWQWTGRWVMSRRVHAHRNPLRVWRYAG